MGEIKTREQFSAPHFVTVTSQFVHIINSYGWEAKHINAAAVQGRDSLLSVRITTLIKVQHREAINGASSDGSPCALKLFDAKSMSENYPSLWWLRLHSWLGFSHGAPHGQTSVFAASLPGWVKDATPRGASGAECAHTKCNFGNKEELSVSHCVSFATLKVTGVSFQATVWVCVLSLNTHGQEKSSFFTLLSREFVHHHKAPGN